MEERLSSLLTTLAFSRSDIKTEQFDQQGSTTSGQVAQISVDLLTYIVASNDRLRKEVSLLRSEVLHLKEDVRLKTYSGKTFTWFPMLPLELRQIIWQVYLEIPQVVGVKAFATTSRGYVVATGPHSKLRRVNKEARALALKVQRHYSSFTRSPSIYINPKIDTIWLVGCTGVDFTRREEIWLPNNRKYPRIAIPARIWHDIVRRSLECQDEGQISDFMNALAKMGIRELVLVVGSPRCSNGVDIEFVKPKDPPIAYLPEEAEKFGWENLSWGMLENLVLVSCKRTKDRRPIMRQALLDCASQFHA